jgi:hypothetical protein
MGHGCAGTSPLHEQHSWQQQVVLWIAGWTASLMPLLQSSEQAHPHQWILQLLQALLLLPVLGPQLQALQ